VITYGVPWVNPDGSINPSYSGDTFPGALSFSGAITFSPTSIVLVRADFANFDCNGATCFMLLSDDGGANWAQAMPTRAIFPDSGRGTLKAAASWNLAEYIEWQSTASPRWQTRPGTDIDGHPGPFPYQVGDTVACGPDWTHWGLVVSYSERANAPLPIGITVNGVQIS
jgi:hypothetical protein